jgi:hypothetical protein
MACTDKQIRKLLMEYEKNNHIEKSSLKADLCRQTGSKYLKTGKLPTDSKETHDWRTRQDPFAADWNSVEERLSEAPELEAKILFEWLCEEHPGRYKMGQLRTFQRRVNDWRALNGPDKEVYFSQVHEPGKRMSTDFTSMNKLGITIKGEPFNHLLCHCVLVWSNWEWATVCQSESLLALRQGFQNALVRLGHTPQEHWTDHSTAATKALAIGTGQRGFNCRYLDIMNHYGITPRTIQVNAPNENGDVESLHGVLKRRLEQHLLLRGNRDFDSVDAYQSFIHNILHKANGLRCDRFDKELKQMRLLTVDGLPEYEIFDARVNSWSTVNINYNTYSVPSRLIGFKIRARCHEDHVEIFYKNVRQLTMPRLRGRGNDDINYRHVIGWLLRKPGAFRNYRYRVSLFPTLNFSLAYSQLCKTCSERVADLEYLRILKHAAMTMECEVNSVLECLLNKDIVPRWNTVLEFCPSGEVDVPEISRDAIDLKAYDKLLEEV